MSASGFKQTPRGSGYYISVGDMRTKFYYNVGTDAAPLISTNIYGLSSATSSYMATAGGAVLRDHGKTLVSSGRVFRKVQLLVSTNNVVAGGSDGVAGADTAPTNFLTGYIELPGAGGSASGLSGSSYTPVARLG